MLTSWFRSDDMFLSTPHIGIIGISLDLMSDMEF